MRACFAVATMFLAAASFAQQRGTWTVYGGSSNSVPFLGGEDTRSGFIIGAQYSRPDPRVTFRGKEGEFILDTYFLRTRGQQIDEHPSEFANALGVVATARYWFGSQDHPHWFLDAGLGIQIQDKTSVDLDTYINTTPVLGVGYVFPAGDTEMQVQLRFMHISNGGTNPPNQGQNHLQLLLGARF